MTRDPTAAPAARIRAAGLRATSRRVAVLEVLARAGDHPSAEEIGRALAARGATVPRASLYHVLGSLAAAGVILVADAGPGATRYEAAARWHHHLVCRTCGGVTDVPCVRGERPCLEPDLPGVVVDEAQVIFRGTCAACAARPGARTPAGAPKAAPARPAGHRRHVGAAGAG